MSLRKGIGFCQQSEAGYPAYLYSISFAVCVIKSNSSITSGCLS